MSRNNDYIKQETVTGIVPMLKGDRQYSFLDLFLSTSGFAIATWCYTQGAYVAQYLGFKQMLINIFCFNIVWVLIECLPVLFAVRYGIDLWIWLRSVLGGKGRRHFVDGYQSRELRLVRGGGQPVRLVHDQPLRKLRCCAGSDDLETASRCGVRRARHTDRARRAGGHQVDEPLPCDGTSRRGLDYRGAVLRVGAAERHSRSEARARGGYDAAAELHDFRRGQRRLRFLVVDAGARDATSGQDRAQRLLGHVSGLWRRGAVLRGGRRRDGAGDVCAHGHL